MTGLQTLRRSATQHPEHGNEPAEVLATRGLAFRRYLLVSSGISSTALGLALVVSVFAAGYGEASLNPLAVSDVSSVQVIVRGEQTESLLLDERLGAVARPEPSPAAVETVATQSPVAAINIEPRREPVPQATSQPASPPQRAIVPPGATPAPAPTATARPAAAAKPPASTVKLGRIENVNLTFYDCLDGGFCGTMKSGEKVYEGAAACSWNLPEGTRFRIVGDPTKRTYVCEDRGILEDTWVDVFFYDPEDGWEWQEAVGRLGTIEIVRLP